MRLFRSPSEVRRYLADQVNVSASALDDKPFVAAVGNFDGLHLGHQAIIQALQDSKQEKGQRTLVISFEPRPVEYILGREQAPMRLTSLRSRLEISSALGMDGLCLLRFDGRMRSTSAREFEDRVLTNMKIARLYVGQDFRYGEKRTGNIDSLRDWAAAKGVELVVVPTIRDGDERVSSTRIRTAIVAGDFSAASQMLGRPWLYTGRIRKGRQLGTKLGFPTANIDMKHHCIPLRGVYAVRGYLSASYPQPGNGVRAHLGVCNVGVRPTVEGAPVLPQLETHLFGSFPNLYGSRLWLEFVAKLRDEQKFDSVEALREQISRDVSHARRMLAKPIDREEEKAGG